MLVVRNDQTSSNLHVMKNGAISACLICDDEYPKRVAFSLLQSLINSQITLQYVIKECQDPSNTYQIMRIQKNVDMTKVTLYNTIDKMLERGEKIDDIVKKSEALSDISKDFYDKGKRLNSCCSIA